MDTRRSILLLMNGFGLEVPKSFNVYSATLMPSLAKLSNYYPFASLFASGVEIGLNRGQLSSFREGFSAFSSNGKMNKKSSIVQMSINDNSFITNPAIVASINHAVHNQSRMHILFSIGERTDDAKLSQLKQYAQLCVQCGIKEVYVHLFLGDNSVEGLKVSNAWIKNLKYHVMNFVPQMKIVSIAGRKYLAKASKEEKINYYRMIVSGVGEVWSNYEETIEKKYKGNFNDDTMGGFLTVRENLIRANDSVMNFNYDSSVGAEYLDVIQNPNDFFPAGKIPLNVAVNSLFEVQGNPKVPYAFEGDLPEHYFFENIPDDKRVLIIADRDRVQYISKCLNGFRDQFKPNINVWPIEDKKQRFELMAQYLNAYINQNVYDLIIADCDLFNDQYEQATIEQLRANMAALDKILNVAYTRGMEKGYTLYATSFYGIKRKFFLTKTYEEVDFSLKTPLLVAANDIGRNNTSIQIDGNFTQVAQVIQKNMGANVEAKLISPKTAGRQKKKLGLLIAVVGAAFILFIVYYLISAGYI